MNILITNDDGIESPGLKALKSYFVPEHTVWMVAPEQERSGTSHSITLKEPVRFRKIEERTYSCTGTPADCILYSILGALETKPDIIISGINLGPNLGTDIIYSGTAAAARQAALMGYPGVAVSVVSYTPPFFFARGAEFINRNLETFVSRWTSDHFININIPNNEESDSPVEITRPARRIYRDQVENFTGSNGDRYFFLKGPLPGAHPEEGTDWDAVSRNRVSICPIYLYPQDHIGETFYRESDFK